MNHNDNLEVGEESLQDRFKAFSNEYLEGFFSDFYSRVFILYTYYILYSLLVFFIKIILFK